MLNYLNIFAKEQNFYLKSVRILKEIKFVETKINKILIIFNLIINQLKLIHHFILKNYFKVFKRNS